MGGGYDAVKQDGKSAIKKTGAGAGSITKLTATVAATPGMTKNGLNLTVDGSNNCNPKTKNWGTTWGVLVRGCKQVTITAEAPDGTNVTWGVFSMDTGGSDGAPALGSTTGKSTTLATDKAGGWAVGASVDGGNTYAMYVAIDFADVTSITSTQRPNVKLGWYTEDDGSFCGFSTSVFDSGNGKPKGIFFNSPGASVDATHKGWYVEIGAKVSAAKSPGSIKLGYLQNVYTKDGSNFSGLKATYDGGGEQKLMYANPVTLDGPPSGTTDVPFYAVSDDASLDSAMDDSGMIWRSVDDSYNWKIKLCDSPCVHFAGNLGGKAITGESGTVAFKAALVAWSTRAPGVITVVAIAWWSIDFSGTIRESHVPGDHSKVGSQTGGGVVTSGFGTSNPQCPGDAVALGFTLSGPPLVSGGMSLSPKS